MAYGFFTGQDKVTGQYQTTARNILIAKRFFDANPDLQIETGMWAEPTWSKQDFYHWFRRCLNYKTGGSEYSMRQWALASDGRKISRYMQGHRTSGSGYLSSPKLRKRYPHINKQVIEY